MTPDITYMWNLKYRTKEPIHETERQMDGADRQVVAMGRRGSMEGPSGRSGLADRSFNILDG